MSDRNMRFTFYIIILHSIEPKVLVVPDEHGYTLPCFEFSSSEYRHFSFVDQVNRMVTDRFGVKVVTLRCLADEFNAEAGEVNRLYVVENLESERPPPDNTVWIGWGLLRDWGPTSSMLNIALSSWLLVSELGKSPLHRRPWTFPGWFTTAVGWIHKQLHSLGVPDRDIEIEQLRTWAVSCILLVRTTASNFYFKALPHISAHEFRLIRVLEQYFPVSVPTIIAIEAKREWMLMQSFDGIPLKQVSNVSHWEEAVNVFAHIQICLTNHKEELVLNSRESKELKTQITGTLPGLARRLLSSTEVNKLEKLVPYLEDACLNLASYNLPRTLDHGDLHADNIFVTDNGYMFIDWADSTITHPFFSLVPLLCGKKEICLPDIPDVSKRLRDAYLEPWRIYEPEHHLVEAFAMAQPLAILHQALTYHSIILPSLEPLAMWELEGMLPFYLSMLLRHFSAKPFGELR